MKGRIFEIREFTLHDGPGVRTTVFMKGCPLRCAWCHNPEGQSFETETMRSAAPGGSAPGADRTVGRDWTPEDLASELLKNADIMAQSGGGVTFSGGEPLAQCGFILETLPLLKAKGVDVAVETSGYVPLESYRAAIPQFDFVYQDVKLLDAAEFRRWTCGDVSVVLDNIAYLRESGVRFVFRVPLVPGVNDSPSDRAAFVEFARGCRMEFLPYNPAAGAKYPLLGRKFPLDGIPDAIR